MNVPEQHLAELERLLVAEPDKAIPQVRLIVKVFHPETTPELTDSQKSLWVNLMLTYSSLLQQAIQTSDDLNEALDTIAKIQLLCDKKSAPFEWSTSNCTAGKLYMQYIDSFTDFEQARLAAIASFEEALTVGTGDSYFINWLQAHIYLADVYLFPGDGKNEYKALALLDRIFPVTINRDKDTASLEEKMAAYPFPNTIAKAKKQKETLAYINRYSYPFFESLMSIAGLYHKNGNLTEAIIHYKAATAIIKELEGDASPLFRAVRDNLRIMNYAAGNVIEGAIPIQDKDIILQPFTEQAAEDIYRLQTDRFVGLYIEAKNYRTACELLVSALQLCTSVHNNYTLLFTYRSQLGDLYLKSNLFTSSLQTYLGALQLYERCLQDTDLQIAPVYDAIARLLIDYFRFVIPAKYYLTKSLEIQESSPSFTLYKKADMHLLFARYYLEVNDLPEAQRYYDLYTSEIRHINEKADGAEPVLPDETILGELYESKGDYANAEKCYSDTLQRMEQSATGEKEKIVTLYLRLGELCEKWKRPGVSPFDFYIKGLNIANKYSAGGYLNLAKLHYRYSLYIIKYGNSQNVLHGLELLRASAHKDSNYMAEVFAIGSEEHRAMMMKELYEKVFVMISVFLHYNIQDISLYNILYNYILRRKAINLKIDYLYKRETKDSLKSEHFKQVQKQLYSCYDEISMAVITGSSTAFLDSLAKKTKQVLYEKELLVLQEMQILDPLSIEEFLTHENVGSVFFNLPEESVIIEFVKYQPFQFNQQHTDTAGNEIKERYMAVVGFCRMLDMKLIDVGACDEIDPLIHSYRQAVTSNGKPDNSDTLTKIGSELRERVFDIFLSELDNRKRIVIAPDGDLSFLPFESLPAANNQYLIDEYTFSYVNSGRDVVSFKMGSIDIENDAPVVMGNPKFSVDPDADLLQGDIYFKKLAGTQTEIEDIAQLLQVPPVSGEKVSKEAILQLTSPKFLHLATHGYNISGTNVINSYDYFYKTMFTNGLSLSGINDYLLSNMEQPHLGNGFLSAVNVLNMDLHKTELVVLSACDAGLGTHANGEGVLGLRRAFNIAGAKSMIISLWKVPDTQTALLMHQFYQRLLSGEARVHALRNAQLSVKSQYPLPIYWGSFICLGIPSKVGIKSMEQYSE